MVRARPRNPPPPGRTPRTAGATARPPSALASRLCSLPARRLGSPPTPVLPLPRGDTPPPRRLLRGARGRAAAARRGAGGTLRVRVKSAAGGERGGAWSGDEEEEEESAAHGCAHPPRPQVSCGARGRQPFTRVSVGGGGGREARPRGAARRGVGRGAPGPLRSAPPRPGTSPRSEGKFVAEAAVPSLGGAQPAAAPARRPAGEERTERGTARERWRQQLPASAGQRRLCTVRANVRGRVQPLRDGGSGSEGRRRRAGAAALLPEPAVPSAVPR